MILTVSLQAACALLTPEEQLPVATQAAPPSDAATIALPTEDPGGTQPASPPPTGLPPQQPSGQADRIGFLGIELQPEDPMPGGQYLLLLNPTSSEIELRCWSIRSAASSSSWVIMGDVRLAPDTIARVTIIDGAWQAADQLQLLDSAGQLVDESPALEDAAYDDQIWFVDPDGSWQFGRTIFAQLMINLSASQSEVGGCE